MFKIETINDKLKAEKGNATTVFTVTNTTPRPLRGIARIKPLGSTESAWIKIEGETERDFPPGEEHKFEVNFSKPQPPEPQPAGSFQFRFDVVSAANPDEDFTVGPIVTVEVAASGAAKKFPWWILIVVGILLVVGIVAAILVFRNGGDEPLPPTPTPTATPTPTPEKVKVPAVINKTFAEAEKELREAGFKVEKAEEIAADKPLDKVLKQDPTEEAEPNSKVTLTIPAATTVPPLKGMCAVEAVQALQKNQLVAGELSGNMERIKTCQRQVGSTDPPMNQPIAKGASVKLIFPCNPEVEECRLIIRPEILKELLKASPSR